MSDERPCKRSRTEDSSAEAVSVGCRAEPITATDVTLAKPNGPTRDEDIWFSTGNLVIVANGEVAFRVYRGVLANKSEIFRGLFELPPTSECEKMDDCPVVHLCDSPKDLKHLLLVIFCRKNYFYHRDEPTPVPFNTLASLIRMAHKYNVYDLYRTSLERLQKYYTSDLDTWDNIWARRRYVKTGPSDVLTVLKLAHLTETPSLLPIAYFICCSLGDARRVRLRTGEQTPLLSELSMWDYQRVFTGKAELAKTRAERIWDMLRAIPCEECKRPERCAMAAQTALKRFNPLSSEEDTRDLDALQPGLSAWFWRRGLEERPCGPCTTASDEAQKKMRLETWRKLPGIFGVEVEDWAKEADAGGETEVDVEAESEAEDEEA